ncbi:MAG TPA: B-box zinc finger protein [Bryobacteraceae bacterium]|nr:B-box zinc finger protein [Bryobacteraceae bacterium]
MNCYLHPDAEAAGYCRSCGRPLCNACRRPAEGTVFCQEHVLATASYAGGDASRGNPYLQNAAAAAPVNNSPGLAFVLGLIPGVGSIYNGQYLKGLVHAIIFGLLISLANSAEHTAGQPLLGMMCFAFYCYMPFEAFHTAKKRQAGLLVEEWSSLLAQHRYTSRAPLGPILLILLGVLFLLDTLRVVEFRELARFWPILLILVGAFMLYNRVATPVQNMRPPVSPAAPRAQESQHEQ